VSPEINITQFPCQSLVQTIRCHMRIWFAVSVVLVLLQGGPAIADMQCGEKPDIVKNYLRSNPSWSIVSLNDLQADDQKLWKEKGNGLCPGLATVRLSQTNAKSYAVALLRTDGNVKEEKLVLLSRSESKYKEQSLVDPVSTVNPFVVYRVGPGKSYDAKKRKYVHLNSDSIVFEKLESTSTSFYYVDGKLRSLVGSF